MRFDVFSQMGKLTTMPAGLIYASISVHAAKEEESKKQLVKPEQVTCLQKIVNFVWHKYDVKTVRLVCLLTLFIKNVFEIFVRHVF